MKTLHLCVPFMVVGLVFARASSLGPDFPDLQSATVSPVSATSVNSYPTLTMDPAQEQVDVCWLATRPLQALRDWDGPVVSAADPDRFIPLKDSEEKLSSYIRQDALPRRGVRVESAGHQVSRIKPDSASSVARLHPTMRLTAA